MIRRPPRSTLFPTRRSSDLSPANTSTSRMTQIAAARLISGTAAARLDPLIAWWRSPPSYERSEEHTSELQSQSNLVCRLLLEKKKESKHMIRDHREIVRMVD